MRSRTWGPVSILRGTSGGAVRRSLREQPPAEKGRPWTSRRLHTGVPTNVILTSQDNVDIACHLVTYWRPFTCQSPQVSPRCGVNARSGPLLPASRSGPRPPSLGSLSRVSSLGLSLTPVPPNLVVGVTGQWLLPSYSCLQSSDL